MCTCHLDEKGRPVVCDACASAQIEAKNASSPGQVELVPSTLAPLECERLVSAVVGYFAQFQPGGHA